MERYICTKPQSSFIPCGAIVCAKKKHSHHTLVEYNDAEYYVSNDNIDPFLISVKSYLFEMAILLSLGSLFIILDPVLAWSWLTVLLTIAD